MDTQKIQYKGWRDKAGNIGIECLACHRDHWTGNEPTLDIIRQKECDNCVAIKQSQLMKKENDVHGQELLDYASYRKTALEHGETIASLKSFASVCIHQPSQPGV